ncbi:MAG: putative 2OG-Fe(II) oxygenase [Novosphingobium sp.]
MNGIGPPGSAADLAAIDVRLAGNPGDRVSWHNRGVELRRLDRPEEALAALERAWGGGLRAPETAMMRGHVLADLGRFDEAERAYRHAIAARPDLVDAQVALATLLPQLGRPDEALDGFRDALARAPQTGALWVAAMQAAQGHGDHPQLLAFADAAEARFGPDTLVTTHAAIALSALGRDAEAYARLDRALDAEPDFAPGHAAMARILLRLGEPAQAAAAAMAANRLAPDEQSGWALLSTAWRVLGDPREDWLCRYEALVMELEVELPAGLTAALEKRHHTRSAPADQSLRGGTQTRGQLFESGEPAVLALANTLAAGIETRLAQLPKDETHPFLARNTGAIAFSASWSVRLASNGFHVSHMHPSGWLSSALYIALPEEVRDSETQGALTFGVPDAGLGLDLPPRRVVRPEIGRLVLFPSYLWHGTTPFESAEHRLTVAFDALPRRS